MPSISQTFSELEDCKRGVYVALSIDGTKKSGKLKVDLPIPEGLFEQEVSIDCGRSIVAPLSDERTNAGEGESN